MNADTTSALTQLGLSAIFAIACVQLFLRLEKSYANTIAHMVDDISELRKQNALLTEQNKQLSVALFANNPDAQRALVALSKTTQTFTPLPTDVG